MIFMSYSSCKVSEQIRFDQDISKFESNLIDIGVQYKPLDFMKFAAFYRLKSRTDEKNHVMILSAYAEKEIKRLSMEYRLRFDNEPNQDKDNEYYLRNRLELYYNIKGPVDPFISGELFYRFNYDKGDRFNSYRLRIGTDFKIAKNQKLTLHYTYDSEFNMKKIDIKRVIGLFYTIEL